MLMKDSPSPPAVDIIVVESLRRKEWNFSFTFMVTSTGVSGRSDTIRIVFTLPMSTPLSRTGAPWRKPLASGK